MINIHSVLIKIEFIFNFFFHCYQAYITILLKGLRVKLLNNIYYDCSMILHTELILLFHTTNLR